MKNYSYLKRQNWNSYSYLRRRNGNGKGAVVCDGNAYGSEVEFVMLVVMIRGLGVMLGLVVIWGGGRGQGVGD